MSFRRFSEIFNDASYGYAFTVSTCVLISEFNMFNQLIQIFNYHSLAVNWVLEKIFCKIVANNYDNSFNGKE